MGQTISTRFDWSESTSANPVDGSQSNLLAKSLNNNELLTDLVQYIEHLCQHYPNESKVEFKRPLIYASSILKASHFSSEKAFAVQGNKYGPNGR